MITQGIKVVTFDNKPCNLVERSIVRKHTRGRRIQMLDDLHVNSGYEALKRTTARQKCMEEKQ